MTKTKGRRRRKNSRQDEEFGNDCHNNSGDDINDRGSITEDRDAVATTRSSRKNTGNSSGSSKNNNKCDISFAERRELQRKAAAEKRRQKMKCYLCGKTGHVRRECPGILDDGRGESKHTKSNGDARAVHLKPSKGRKNKKQQNQQQQHQFSKGSRDYHPATYLEANKNKISQSPLVLPPGFEKIDCNETDEDQKVSDDNRSDGIDSSSSIKSKETFLYFDAGYDNSAAVLDYLRFGRHGHVNHRQNNHHKKQASNPHNHTKISRGDAISEYDTAMETVCENTNFGGCILRSFVQPPWKSTTDDGVGDSDQPSSWNPYDSISFSWFHERPTLLKFVVGYPCRYHNGDIETDEDDIHDHCEDDDQELIAGLVQLALAHKGTVVGFFADLDYTSMQSYPKGSPSPSAGIKLLQFERLRRFQLQRLQCTLRAAAEVRCTVQIRIAPGYKACQLSPTPDAVVVGDVGGTATSRAAGPIDGYSQAIRDLGEVLLNASSTSCHSEFSDAASSSTYSNSSHEESDISPNVTTPATTGSSPPSPFRVHLSCWNGKAEHLVALGGAFPPDQLVFGFDGRLGFSKAVHLHESAFEVSLNRIVLETGGPGILPPIVARHGGRNAFCHSGHLPFVAEELARHAGKNPRNHTTSGSHDGDATNAIIPTAALVARCAAKTTKALYGLP